MSCRFGILLRKFSFGMSVRGYKQASQPFVSALLHFRGISSCQASGMGRNFSTISSNKLFEKQFTDRVEFLDGSEPKSVSGINEDYEPYPPKREDFTAEFVEFHVARFGEHFDVSNHERIVEAMAPFGRHVCDLYPGLFALACQILPRNVAIMDYCSTVTNLLYLEKLVARYEECLSEYEDAVDKDGKAPALDFIPGHHWRFTLSEERVATYSKKRLDCDVSDEFFQSFYADMEEEMADVEYQIHIIDTQLERNFEEGRSEQLPRDFCTRLLRFAREDSKRWLAEERRPLSFLKALQTHSLSVAAFEKCRKFPPFLVAFLMEAPEGQHSLSSTDDVSTDRRIADCIYHDLGLSCAHAVPMHAFAVEPTVVESSKE